MSEARRVFIKTYGCQMNVYDSDRMADVLAQDGYVAAETAGEADLVLLNTCHIREKAAEKVYSEVGRMRVLKEAARAQGRDMRIAVAGCVAQADEGGHEHRSGRGGRPQGDDAGHDGAVVEPPCRAHGSDVPRDRSFSRPGRRSPCDPQ